MTLVRWSISKRNTLKHALRLCLAFGIAFILSQIKMPYIEALTYDLRVRVTPSTPVSNHIQLIAIDPRTQETLNHNPRALDHKKLLDALKKANPRYVVYTTDLEKMVGSYEELEAFAEATNQLNFFATADGLPVKGLEDDFRLLPPLQDIRKVSAPPSWDRKVFANDNVTRRLIYSFQDEKLLHGQLASSYNNIYDVNDYRGLFRFKRTLQAYIDFRPTGTYKPVSFLDVMNGDFDPKIFEDKIVLIGQETKSVIKDYILTPLSRDVIAMSKLEMHANIIDTLLLNTAPILPPHWISFLFTLLISIITVFVVLTVRPAKGLLILAGTGGLFFVFCFLSYAFSHLWVEMSHPLLAIFICYYFFIPYRLIVENKKTWEYYQKNTLLTQVEELKSNFLRMMSHDLKTPLARIQGMTEVALADKTQLSKKQKGALLTIQKSSEELSDFIGSILNLGRIESKEIKLMLKSRDINSLITEVIKGSDFLAKDKNIEIITDFEPLFSVNMDEDLIRQVFTNLIENAIKYSSDNTKILVSTEELNGKIMIQVADQGIGIPVKDLENVFGKFYRSQPNLHEQVKGSGLGLYLANYFISLHGGTISAESELHNGSTFSVEFPMDL